jgi:conjugative relaxase-like TrwC/TraI family protein
MLIATQAQSIAGTEKYFDTTLSQGDYYTGQEVAGTWHGQGADILGLEGGAVVTKEQFKALLAGYHPITGKKLAQRSRKDRRPGVDFTFSVPKSVSLVEAINNDVRILEVFREAVHETMQDVEALMCRRVRSGDKAVTRERVRTGKLIFGEFLHRSARPVDGQVDPHLHIHAFCMNWTFDGNKHYAAEMEEIIRQRASIEARFEARLAHKLQHQLGYAIERTQYVQGGRVKTGWEIQGIDRSTIEKFSARTQQVEAYAQEHGIAKEADKAKLGVRTREKKDKGTPIDVLRNQWHARLTPAERAAFAALQAGAIGNVGDTSDSRQATLSVRYALDHHLYRQSTEEKHAVVATALEHGLTLLPEQVEAALAKEDIIRRTIELHGAEREFITTREVLEAESRMIAFARDGRGTRMTIARGEHVFERDWLNDQQKAAVRHVLNSRDTVTAILGGAGTGKSSLLEELAGAIDGNGKKLFVVAPSTGAREVLEEKGFTNAQTVEHLLRNERLHAKLKDQVILVDEASLLDVRSMNGLFDLAQQHNVRIVLSGDNRQHSSARRGEATRILEKEAGLNIARVEEIQRQKGRYKRAVELISQGHTIVDKKRGLTGLVAGFDLLDRMGKIREILHEDRHAVLAEQYLKSSNGKQSPLVVAPTHAEGQAATQRIREGLRGRGAIGKKEREFLQLKSLNLSEAERTLPASYRQEGIVIQFHQNAKGGYQRGERYRVSRDKSGEPMLTPMGGGPLKPIPYANPDRFEVYAESKLGFAVGDKIRFSLGGKASDGKRRISNGRLDEIQGFDRQGNLRLKSGMTVAHDYGHLDFGYVTTSHAAQGKDRELAIAAMGSQSLPAVNAKQFYVTVSRGSKDVAIYVDDKAAVRRAIERAGEQLSATELVNAKRVTGEQQSRQQTQHRRMFMDRVRTWWQASFPQRETSVARAPSPTFGHFARPEISRG